MSTLLSELSLDYEILADDPIEKGIQFGQSILNHVSSEFADSMENITAYSKDVASEISATVTKAATFVYQPKQVELQPVGAPISLAGRALKPRTSIGTSSKRSNAIDFQRRQTVTTGIRPVRGRGDISYRPRAYASRSTFLVGSM